MIASLIWLAGCVEPSFVVALEPLAPPPDNTVTVLQLWDSPGFEGTVSTISPLIVTSPRTADGAAFYASDPLGGPRSGVRVLMDPTSDDWVPPVGTRIQLTAYVVHAGLGPILEAGGRADVRDVGIVGIPPVTPYAGNSGLDHSLVSLADVTVTSRPNPLGNADLNGVSGLGGLFGAGPGWNRSGDLVGILDGGRISPRGKDDWTGDLVGDPPVVTDLAGVAELANGTPVLVDDLVLATPWSRDGRWAVVQDAEGVGRWVDAQAWGLWASVAAMEVGSWTGEVRRDEGGVVLRVWDPPVLSGSREPLIVEPIVDGALVEVEVTGIRPPDPWGERPTDDFVLDDRFGEIGAIEDPATVVGAVRMAPGLPYLATVPP